MMPTKEIISESTRYCRKFWNYGVRTLSQTFSLKKLNHSSREMTTPLFLLRCTEIGISIRDLDLLTIGLVMDMWTEKGNDSAKYSTTITAGQEEFDRF